MIKLFYWNDIPNAGDYYSIWLAKKLYKNVCWSAHPRYIITGSILGFKGISNNTIVWGAGWHNSKWSKTCPITNKKNFRAVRGKLTAEFLHLPKKVALGDPGLLASRFFTPKSTEKTNKILIISHWQDYKVLKEKFGDKYKVLNMRTNDVDSILEEISHSEFVFSSSLHGIIFAHSLGVPAVHLEESDIGSKDNFKFKDYYSVLDIPYIKYKSEDIEHFGSLFLTLKNASKYLPSREVITKIQDNLLAVCPKEEEVEQSMVALCAIAKNENNYIKEWVDHYKQLGFDKIFLFDNNDIDGERFDKILETDIKQKFVEIIDVRGKTNQQIACYNELYHSKKLKNYQWVAFFDIDEFLCTNNQDIHEWLANPIYDNFDGIAINWKYFDDNDLYKVENDNYSITRFTHEYEEKDWQYAQHRFTKRILRTNCDLTINSSHGPLRAAKMSEYKGDKTNNIIVCNVDGQKIINDIVIKNWTYTNGYLAHYRFKTIEEYINNKMKRGYPTLYKNSGKDMKIADFFALNDITPEKLHTAAALLEISSEKVEQIGQQAKEQQENLVKKTTLEELQRKNKEKLEKSKGYLYF